MLIVGGSGGATTTEDDDDDDEAEEEGVELDEDIVEMAEGEAWFDSPAPLRLRIGIVGLIL